MAAQDLHSYAQEPLYVNQDATILGQYGIRKEDYPDATMSIENTTFLYMPFLERRAVLEGLHMEPGVVFANKIEPETVDQEERDVLKNFRDDVKFERPVGHLLENFGRPFRDHYLYAI